MYDLILVGKYEKYSVCILIPPPPSPPGVSISLVLFPGSEGLRIDLEGESLYRGAGLQAGLGARGAGLGWLG